MSSQLRQHNLSHDPVGTHLSRGEAAIGIALLDEPLHDGERFLAQAALQVRQQGVRRHLHVDGVGLAPEGVVGVGLLGLVPPPETTCEKGMAIVISARL